MHPAESAPVLRQGVIDSSRVRYEWAKEALSEFPDRPLYGHGVAQLVDRTPEAYQMGIAGERVWPHNDLVEAAFSLGLLGLVPLLAMLAIPAWLLARQPRLLGTFAASLSVFTFVQSNVSGEIGSDVALWASAALAIGVTVGAEDATILGRVQ